jgi:hypothetical protein
MRITRRYPLSRTSKLLHNPLKRSILRATGQVSKAWKEFRNAKLIRDRAERDTIVCQDFLIGLAPCGTANSSPDLHHVFGREGELLFDETHMVWLTRKCHIEAHEKTVVTREAYNTRQCT